MAQIIAGKWRSISKMSKLIVTKNKKAYIIEVFWWIWVVGIQKTNWGQ